MFRLIIVSIVWAFSFSLIGNFIVGKMDTYLAILIRFSIALFVFLPFLKSRKLIRSVSVKLIAVGALQVGVMYVFYFNSFKYLSVVEVALFTVITPLYISLISSFLEREFRVSQALNVLLVVGGAIIIKWNEVSRDFFLGFLLVQSANFCFALGQILYKRYVPNHEQKEYFSFFYIGALIPIIFLVLIYSDLSLQKISQIQWIILFWLGAVASGVGYYLWNSGAKLVSSGELAVMNNAVIPLAIIVNILFWNKGINWVSFLFGFFLIILGVVLETWKKSRNL